MNVARLNLAHGSHAYHQGVVERIRKLNREKGFSVAVMVSVWAWRGSVGCACTPCRGVVLLWPAHTPHRWALCPWLCLRALLAWHAVLTPSGV